MGDINVYTGPMKCGKTQKILDEAKRQDILVGDEDLYMPVCRKCYEKLIKNEV